MDATKHNELSRVVQLMLESMKDELLCECVMCQRTAWCVNALMDDGTHAWVCEPCTSYL